MARSHRKDRYVKLPSPPAAPRLPEVGLGKAGKIAAVKGPKGSTIRVPPNQPQRSDVAIWGWWMAAFPLSTFDEYLTAYGLVQNGVKMVGCPYPPWRGDTGFLFQKNELTQNGFLLPGVYHRTDIDFLVVSQFPYVAIFEDGLYFHQQSVELDLTKRVQLQQYTGFQVVTIDDVDIEKDAVFYVREALAGRDHSHLKGRV